MTPTARLRHFIGLGAICTLTLSHAAFGQLMVEEAVAPRTKWSTQVWDCAHRGDMKSLTRLLNEPPVAPEEQSESVTRFRAALELHQANQDRARDSLAQSRDEAVAEMRDRLAGGDHIKALRAAIQVQDLSENFDSVLDNQDVQQIIAWAKGQIPLAESKNDWLQAQELLFLLRTLYEDTHDTGAYADYDKQLDGINRRVALLAQYAPSSFTSCGSRRPSAMATSRWASSTTRR